MASTFTVTTNQDNTAPGSLRWAINSANATPGNDVIDFNFASSSSPYILYLTSGLPAIINAGTVVGSGVGAGTAGSVTINGLGSSSLNINANLGNFSIFNIAAGGDLTISGVTVSGSRKTGDGGGFSNLGALTISNATISDNSATNTGGGIGNGATGILVVSDSTISGNTAGFAGGGIRNSGGAATVNGSTISGNSGDYSAGISATGGTFILNNSTLFGNTAQNQAGGIGIYGGVVDIIGSTISGNSASSSATGGGIYNNSGSTLNISNTIIANSSSGGDYAGSGTVNGTSANNLVSQGSFSWATTKTSSEINLGSLQNNGGPTQTLALLAGSVASRAGNAAISNAAPISGFDQRGIARSSTAPSIGAYEYIDTTAPTLSSSTPADDATAVAIGSNIVLNFSETVIAGSGDIIIKKVSDNSAVATINVTDVSQVSISGSGAVTINPTSDLNFSTAYYVAIASGAFKDAANNGYAGISSSSTLNFTTAAAPASPSSGGSSDPGPSQQPATPVDTTPADPAPAGTNIQPTDADGDGLREVIIASDGATVDGNRDGIPDVQQTEVAGLRLINDGAVGSDYGALVVNPGIQLSGVTLTAPSSDSSLPVTARSGVILDTTTPHDITNFFAGVVSFNVSGVTPGGSTQATINFPTGLAAGSGNAYVRFNYATNRFEEYVDASGNPLYTFVDSDGDGVLDAVNLTLVDGDPNWDGDGQANGTVVDPGFLGSGERIITGTRRGDTLIGNVLANTLNGKKGKDWLQGDLGNDILKGSLGNDRLYGGEGADQITGGQDKDRFIYTAAVDSSTSLHDTVKFGSDDRFVFSLFDGDSTTEGQQKLSFIGKSTFSGVAGELRATRSVLEADLNGDSIADFAINLRGNTLISSSNLVL